MAAKKYTAQSVRKKNRYGTAFFYAFCIAFIVLGIVALVIFMNSQDSNIFDFSSRALYDEARQYMLVPDYENAEASLLECLDRNNSNSDAILLLADIYEKQERYDDCIKVLSDCIANSSKNAKNDQLYKRMIQMYVLKGDLVSAVNFSSTVSTYVNTRLSKVRPKQLKVTPGGGTYDAFQSVVIKSDEGTTVYYTLDGTVPSFDSPVCTEETPVSVGAGTTTLRAVAVSPETNLISEEYKAEYVITGENSPYTFKDKAVEAMVRAQLGKSSGTVYVKDIAGITSLDGTQGSYGKIQTLEDLTAFSGLTELILSGQTTVADFEFLKNAPALTRLTLKKSNITDGDAAKIFASANLIYLDLSENKISDISGITSQSRLATLNLSDNSVADASVLGNLTGLASLDISGNDITTVDWAGSLFSLTYFKLGDNSVKDYSVLTKLNKLATLSINYAGITDVSFLASLKTVKNLEIKTNYISDLTPVTGMTNLEKLDVSNNKTAVDYSVLTGCKKLSVLTATDVSAEEENALAVKNITVVKG